MRARSGDEAGVEAVLHLVTSLTGLHFVRERRESAVASVRRLMRQAGIRDVASFCEHLEADRALHESLVSELTVGESYFFREPGQFDFLRNEVIPQLAVRRTAGEPIRCWSAGCAAGEEAYSLAITLEEAGLGSRAIVIGTDLSEHRLARARRARYTKWALRGVSDAAVRRYFRMHRGLHDLLPELRSRVRFARLNLADPESGLPGDAGKMDVVFCRNVMIYFDEPTIERVARRLMDSLSEGGWLFLGASDPGLAGLVECEVVMTGAGLAYRGRSGSDRRHSVIERIDPAPAAPEPRAAAPEVEWLPPITVAPAPTPNRELFTTGPRAPDDGGCFDAEQVQRLASRGALAEAGRRCIAALERYPQSPDLNYLHALLIAQAGHDEQAAAAARRTLYLDRGLVMAHVLLGNSLARLGRENAARRAFRSALQLLDELPDNFDVPWCDGQSAAELTALVRARLELLTERAAG